MASDPRKRVVAASERHEAAKERTRLVRDEAILAAFDAGVSHQEIATLADMSYGNVRKICRIERARQAAAKKPRGR